MHKIYHLKITSVHWSFDIIIHLLMWFLQILESSVDEIFRKRSNILAYHLIMQKIILKDLEGLAQYYTRFSVNLRSNDFKEQT